MRICHIINNLSPTGGAQQLLVDLAKRRGETEFVVICLEASEGALQKSLTLAGVRVVNWTSHSWRAVWTAMRWADVIHAHLFPSWYVAALIPHQRPVFYTEHSTFNRRRRISAFRWVERALLFRISTICCISSPVETSVRSWLGDLSHAKTVVVENGIALEEFSGHRAKYRPDDFRIGMVARFTHQKDQATLIRAVAACPPGVQLVLYGEGELQIACKSLVSDLGLGRRVTFMGQVPRDSLPAALAKLNLYVQSSHWEGFGLAAVEAMAVGLPTIASDVPGLRDVVAQPSLCFQPGDHRCLAHHIITLMESRKLWAEASEESLEAASQYSIIRTSNHYHRLYAQAVGLSALNQV